MAVRCIHGQGCRLGAVSLALALLTLGGCATKQDVLQIDESVRQMRTDQRLLDTRLARIDSLLASGNDQNSQGRAEIRTSFDDLLAQVVQMQSQFSDLQQLIYQMSGRIGESGPPRAPAAATIQDSSAANPADTGTAATVNCRNLWDNAFKDMKRGQYELAISGFSDYLKYCQGSDMADNSQYWIAEAYYEMKQFERANEEYNRLLKQYPQSEMRSKAYFKLGRCYEELGNEKKAMEYFLVLKKDYPGTVEYERVRDKVDAWQKEPKKR